MEMCGIGVNCIWIFAYTSFIDLNGDSPSSHCLSKQNRIMPSPKKSFDSNTNSKVLGGDLSRKFLLASRKEF